MCYLGIYYIFLACFYFSSRNYSPVFTNRGSIIYSEHVSNELCCMYLSVCLDGSLRQLPLSFNIGKKKKSSNFLIIQNFPTVIETSVATNHFKLLFVMGYIKNQGYNSC